MKNTALLLLLITTLLYAEPEEVTSNLVLESESFELDHKSAYGTPTVTLFLQQNIRSMLTDVLCFIMGQRSALS